MGLFRLGRDKEEADVGLDWDPELEEPVSPLSEFISSLTFLTPVALEDLNALCLDVIGSASLNGEWRDRGVEREPPAGGRDNELGPSPGSGVGMGRDPEAELVMVAADDGGAEVLMRGDTSAVNWVVGAAAVAAAAVVVLAAELAAVELVMVVAVLAAVVTVLGADDEPVGVDGELVEVEDVPPAAGVLPVGVVLPVAVEVELLLEVLMSASPPVMTILR